MLRLVHPVLGEISGTADEVAAFVRNVGLVPSVHAGAQATASLPVASGKLKRVPNNDELLVEYRAAPGLSKQTRGQYVKAVEEFERVIAPKSFVDATVDDVLRYEKLLLDVCKHKKSVYLDGPGRIAIVPKMKCMVGLYATTLTPPENCARACPQWEQQTTGPAARLGALSNFYDWLELRGLVASNIARLPMKAHADALPPKDARGKYAPSTQDVRDLVHAAVIEKRTRDAALLLFLCKTGRRPGHVLKLMARDLHLTRDGVSWVTFDGVRSRIRRESGHTKTKLRGEIVSIIDAELRDYLLDHYLPWRLKEYGYAHNEGYLFIGHKHNGNAMALTTVQEYVLDKLMTTLRDRAAAPEERERWTRHLDGARLERITPGVFRHWFTTTLKRMGVPDGDIDIRRGDKIDAARSAYLDLTIEDLANIATRGALPSLLP